MRIAQIIGSVTLSRAHPAFRGGMLRLALPRRLDELDGAKPQDEETVVVWDDLGAGQRDLIALAEGPEAAQPFRPAVKPVDAYNAAILDHCEVTYRHAAADDAS